MIANGQNITFKCDFIKFRRPSVTFTIIIITLILIRYRSDHCNWPCVLQNTIRKRSIWSWCINARWKCELNGLTSRLVCPSGKNGGNAFWDCQICHLGNKKKTSNYAKFCICTKKVGLEWLLFILRSRRLTNSGFRIFKIITNVVLVSALKVLCNLVRIL